MIETEQTVTIDAPIGSVWDFAQDISGWARLMPGLQDCRIMDEDNSFWTLKVGAGALVRTVKVSVNVDRWAGPEEVDFNYVLAGDPVKGAGTYRARAMTPDRTEMTLAVQVEGTGPMAPMWEAMGRPLLPKFALGFAEQFKEEVERAGVGATAGVEPAAATERASGLLARLRQWIWKLLGLTAKAAR